MMNARRAVDVILKLDALLRDFSQLRQRKNLVTAAIGQDGSVPVHKVVQAAKMFDHIESRPNE